MNLSLSSSSRSSLSAATQAGLLAGPFLSMLDSNIVNVALPDIALQLHSSLETAQWIVSGYLLALAAVLAASAYLARRFGTSRVYLVSLLGFTVASALCALAPTLGVLIAARALQGALGAPLVPLAMGMLLGQGGAARQMSPAAGMVLFLAPALGPTIGGLLLHLGGWPLIFLINVPFGLVGALSIWHFVRRTPMSPQSHTPFDVVGLLLLSAGLVLAIYGATQGAQFGWTTLSSWPYLVCGLCLLTLYVGWASRHAHPAVDLGVLRHPQPALAVGLSALVAIVLFVMVFLLPVFLESVQGFSPLVAGLALLPQGLVTGVGTVLGMRLAARRGTRLSAVLGMAILTVSTVALFAVQLATPAWITALILSGRGMALGLTIQPLLNTMMGNLSPEQIPDGNTLFNVAQRLGGSIGIPLLATFFAVRERVRLQETLQSLGFSSSAVGQGGGTSVFSHLPAPVQAHLAQAAVTGFHDTIWLVVVLSVLGLVLACFLRDRPVHHAPEAATSDMKEVVHV
jgi:EmrB/QacA subfamily drug resistance transporter